MISLIVPVYNIEQHLPQCLESIINQTFKDLEILLVDDGSQDCCSEICNAYSRKDNRIKVYHTKNCGLSAARNYGITKATGEYLGFVDGDDWIEPDMFETLLKNIQEQEADVSICGFYSEYPKKTIADNVVNKVFDNKHDLLKALISGKLGHGVWNKLYRKKVFKDYRFPEKRVFEDIATLYKVFAVMKKAVCISKPLYHYRIRKNSITQTYSWKYLIDYWLAIKERNDFFSQENEYLSDKELVDLLQYRSAMAIARTWRWVYGCTKRDKIFYQSYIDEMRAISRQQLPWLGKKEWPLFLRFSCFMSKFDSPLVFATLYYLNQVNRKITNNGL